MTLSVTLRSIFGAVLLLSCGGLADVSQIPDEQDTPVLTDLSGAYLGQTPPGTVPARFATGEFLSNALWGWHGRPVFSPDGRELFFTVMDKIDPSQRIYLSKIVNDRWTRPAPAPFCQEGACSNATYSPDGNTVYFLKRGGSGFLYRTERAGDGWSDPVQVPVPIPEGYTPGWTFSLGPDETLFLELWGPDSQKIYSSRKVQGGYVAPEPLFPSNDRYQEYTPFVDPDQDFVLFSSDRPDGVGMRDLVISFRNPDGTWSEWRNLGQEINTPGEDFFPCVSPDGLYFFFVTSKPGDDGDNPYWIDARVIEDLRGE